MMPRGTLFVALTAATLLLSNSYGGQSGYYAIVGNSDREYSPTIPKTPWPDAFCRHDQTVAVSVCERGLP
jgi:hypothetical protein